MENGVKENRLKDDEYEKQYYGFSTTELYVDFKEQTYKALQTALIGIDASMKKNGYSQANRAKRNGELFAIYKKSAEKSLERFKNEIEKIFEIPRNVVLNEDRDKTEQYTDEDITQLRKEVKELEKEFLREQVFLAKCERQKKFIDNHIKPTFDKINSIQASLKSILKTRDSDDNSKKLLDLHEQHVQYYFGNENGNEQNPILQVEKDFLSAIPFNAW